MNQKEINELRRRFRPEKSAISRVYGCYVNSSKEIVSDLDESPGHDAAGGVREVFEPFEEGTVRFPGEKPH